MRVLRAFAANPRPRHLRELSSSLRLSVGGTADILRRLSELGVLSESKSGNRKCYQLQLEERERKLLQALAALYDESLLKQRALRFSRGASEKLRWMDETYLFLQEVKGRCR